MCCLTSSNSEQFTIIKNIRIEIIQTTRKPAKSAQDSTMMANKSNLEKKKKRKGCHSAMPKV